MGMNDSRNLLSGFQNNCNYQGKSRDLKKEEIIPKQVWESFSKNKMMLTIIFGWGCGGYYKLQIVSCARAKITFNNELLHRLTSIQRFSEMGGIYRDHTLL